MKSLSNTTKILIVVVVSLGLYYHYKIYKDYEELKKELNNLKK